MFPTPQRHASTGVTIDSCDSGYYNVNGIAGDGCETQADLFADSFSTASNLGTLNLGSSRTVTGNIVPQGDVIGHCDFCIFAAGAAASIQLTTNPGSLFRFEVWESGTSQLSTLGEDGRELPDRLDGQAAVDQGLQHVEHADRQQLHGDTPGKLTSTSGPLVRVDSFARGAQVTLMPPAPRVPPWLRRPLNVCALLDLPEGSATPTPRAKEHP